MVTTSDTDEDSTIHPLSGVRVLAVEQMQSLPFATQLLARLGAEVVKVEHPIRGDLGRNAGAQFVVRSAFLTTWLHVSSPHAAFNIGSYNEKHFFNCCNYIIHDHNCSTQFVNYL